MSTPERHKLEFGDRLRELRERAGYSGREFASAAGWQPSKISKIENGRQLPTDADLLIWVRLTEVPEPRATEFRDELRTIRLESSSWKRQLRTGHRRRQERSRGIEAEAGTIRAFELVVVPGLVQTADYARHVFSSAAALQQVPHDTDAAVQVRLERQHALYDSAKHVELLIAESALRYFACPPQTMVAQIDRLIALCGLATVRFGIIPLNTRLPHIPASGFWIIGDTVFVETVNTEISTDDPDDVALYNRLADSLWQAAVEGDDARRLLVQISTDIAQLPDPPSTKD
ncbi:helix-turn-helix transcriptional regulator [Saccharopolyspora sp. NPDC050642]|uniref:helix-turn-helix domain-containing protein n=1 Tax=Saccharopolyspora sp. NPDC050642 TaxID=3157099 RepID=UPI0033D10633